ncbi:hypothetical protein T492DRAFT_993847 [Pavlovales sp. CCMP2436]|nr:hypothetical protein T492DRAFT_993847 [Pavlovales sp. CCMP2436]
MAPSSPGAPASAPPSTLVIVPKARSPPGVECSLCNKLFGSTRAMNRHTRACGTAQTQVRKGRTEQQNRARAQQTAVARRLAKEVRPLVHLREGACCPSPSRGRAYRYSRCCTTGTSCSTPSSSASARARGNRAASSRARRPQASTAWIRCAAWISRRSGCGHSSTTRSPSRSARGTCCCCAQRTRCSPPTATTMWQARGHRGCATTSSTKWPGRACCPPRPRADSSVFVSPR